MHCNILQLDSPPITMEQVTRAFKKQAMRWHPDKHMAKSANTQHQAEARMVRINAAVDFFQEYFEHPTEPDCIVAEMDTPTPTPTPAPAPAPTPDCIISEMDAPAPAFTLTPSIEKQMKHMWAQDLRKLNSTYPRMQLREQTYILILKSIVVNGLNGRVPESLDILFGVADSRKIVETWFINKSDISRNKRIAELVMNNKESQYDAIRSSIPSIIPLQELNANQIYVCYCIQKQMHVYRTLLERGIAPHPTELKVVRWARAHFNIQ